MASITVTSNINISNKLKKIDNDKFWTYAATEWWKLYFNFVPFRDGALAETVKINPKTIEHTVPYARRQYEGYFNFRKDYHPLATRRWDDAAVKAGKGLQLINSLQAYVDSGRLRMNDE